MSKVWKWIVGILIGLVVVGLVVGAVFMVRNRAFMASNLRPTTLGNGQTQPNPQGTPNAPGGQNGQRMPYGWNGQRGPMMPYGFNDRHYPMNGWGERGPMMGGGGFSRFGMFGMGFFFLGGLLHLVVPLGILALVAFIFYQMGKRAGVNSVNPQTPAAVQPAPVETPGRGRKVAKS